MTGPEHGWWTETGEQVTARFPAQLGRRCDWGRWPSACISLWGNLPARLIIGRCRIEELSPAGGDNGFEHQQRSTLKCFQFLCDKACFLFVRFHCGHPFILRGPSTNKFPRLNKNVANEQQYVMVCAVLITSTNSGFPWWADMSLQGKRLNFVSPA